MDDTSEQIANSTYSARASAVSNDGSALRWRCIGPHRGGRVVAVAGDPEHRMVFYHGACAGGVWKTFDGGTYWENVSDGWFGTAAVGALAVAPSDPNVVYAGTGESTIRGNVSHGDGVYRSTDGGNSWVNVGLGDTRHIAKIRVHPTESKLVYVAALGHAWGPNSERGVFRSFNAGETWECVLFESEHAGAIDLAMDPQNPRLMYAATWEAQRSPYSLSSGGSGSKLYRSTDGGSSWTDLSSSPGFPAGVRGKIGVAVSARSGRLWALVEALDGALLRSDDGGDTWERFSEDGELRKRAWYYMHVIADPVDADTVWVLNLQCWKSIDGGRTFLAVPTAHGDNHDLWIDPNDPQRMIEGNDGGACVSFNGGATWSTLYNQPTAQMYHVTTDSRDPYRIYGSQQDNSAIALPGLSYRGAITMQDWYEPGGGESGYIAVHPDDPNIVYGGAIGSGEFNGRLIRYDHATGLEQDITIWPDAQGMGDGADTLKYRFQWTFPLSFSPHDSGELFAASNVLLRSIDEGQSWETISPDLTRADPTTLKSSGGPITQDNTGAEVYGTIFSFSESPHARGEYWTGSDDGLVYISRDAGDTWTDITPAELPAWSLITSLEISPHVPGKVYLCATRYKLDDTRPYLLKTTDYGRTWTGITSGIPEGEFTRVLRADDVTPGLLFVGTETGIWLSFDDGENWARLQGNLPVVPVYDVTVKDNALIAATHGRSFWVLDDITPLRCLVEVDLGNEPHLFPPTPSRRVSVYDGWGYKPGPGVNYRHVGPLVAAYRMDTLSNGVKTQNWLDAGKNPDVGVVLTYVLPVASSKPISLSFHDAEGRLVREFSSSATGTAATSPSVDDVPDASPPGEGVEGSRLSVQGSSDQILPAQAGLNRFVWDMRYSPPDALPGDTSLDELRGPRAIPGKYSATLSVDGRGFSVECEIIPAPGRGTTASALEDQCTLALQIRDMLSNVHHVVADIRQLRQQLSAWTGYLKHNADMEAEARRISGELKAVEDRLVQRDAASPLNPPSRLNFKLATLLESVMSADAVPTKGQHEVFLVLSSQVSEVLGSYDALKRREIPELNESIRRLDIGPIVVRLPSVVH